MKIENLTEAVRLNGQLEKHREVIPVLDRILERIRAGEELEVFITVANPNDVCNAVLKDRDAEDVTLSIRNQALIDLRSIENAIEALE